MCGVTIDGMYKGPRSVWTDSKGTFGLPTPTRGKPTLVTFCRDYVARGLLERVGIRTRHPTCKVEAPIDLYSTYVIPIILAALFRDTRPARAHAVPMHHSS